MLHSKLQLLIAEYGLGPVVDELKYSLRAHVRDLKRLDSPPHAFISDIERVANILEKINLKKYL